ncbi:hypothetical protein QAD02_003148 [Eretmocerus hayati]|uniref:Uncharacterized protein n=1 Tax=Eretmocerus hayati TaxID=131215 RepID=A0ACC2NKV0_9HYME|nr:hypothetical protein QAD02_003148 [Eretmocerus hayati]
MYKDTCMRILLGKVVYIEPQCQIATDAFHFIRALKGWKCWEQKHVTPRQKDILMQSVCLLFDVSHLIVFDEILEHILVLASSKRMGMRYWKSLPYLEERINIRDFKEEFVRLTQVQKKEIDASGYGELDLTRKHIDRIKNRSKVNIDVLAKYDQNNDYYNEEFAQELIDTCKDMVCWTNLMNNHFKNNHHTNSTAEGENYFRWLKSHVKKLGPGKRVDQVFGAECCYIDGIMKMVSADVKDETEERKQEERRSKKASKEPTLESTANEGGSEHLKKRENWRNQLSVDEPDMGEEDSCDMVEFSEPNTAENVQADDESICQRKGKFLTKRPTIGLDMQRPRGKRKRSNCILYNECFSNPRPMKINPIDKAYRVNFARSDALDSITELLSHSYCLFKNFQDSISLWVRQIIVDTIHAADASSD